MKKNIVRILIIMLALASCKNKIIADFEIKNNTGFNLDSLKIEPNIDEINKYISLEKGEKIEYKCDMTTIPKTDGGYQISFLINGKKKTLAFGYYSNGYPSEIITKIKIEKDTLLINQVFKKY